MNYAATLAMLVVLSFTFPLGVRLASQVGISESGMISLLAAVATFSLTVYFVRLQVMRHSLALAKIAEARLRISADSGNPKSFFIEGEHVGHILLQLGRRREAAEIIDRYARLGGAKESEIVALRESLSTAERRQRRAKRESTA